METNNKKVLLIEDANVAIEVMVALAECEKFTLICAKTVAEAEKAIEDIMSYDLVLLDANLGGADLHLDTLPIMEKIKAAGFKKPVLATSNTKEHNAKLIEAGATGEINKVYIMKETMKSLGMIPEK